MRHILAPFCVILFILSGCAASIPPVQVTRFHNGPRIEAAPVQIITPPSLEGANYAASVSRELTRLGFVDARGGAKPVYTAKVEFSRTSRAQTKRSPFSIGVGGGTGGGGVGIGVGTSIGIGGGTRTIIVTQLAVQIIRMADGKPVWEGRAETEAPEKAPASQPGLAADKLSRALFADFPGESGKAVFVP
jgi:hypothetical protein